MWILSQPWQLAMLLYNAHATSTRTGTRMRCFFGFVGDLASWSFFSFLHSQTPFDKYNARTLWRPDPIPARRYGWRFARGCFAKRTLHILLIRTSPKKQRYKLPN
jgi:hypothetical protein